MEVSKIENETDIYIYIYGIYVLTAVVFPPGGSVR